MVNLIWQDRLVSLYAWYLSIGAQQSVSGTTEGNLKVTKCQALWPSCDRLCLVLVNFHSSRIPKRQTSHDDVVAMITLCNSNHSVKEISEQTGVSHNCVRNKTHQLYPSCKLCWWTLGPVLHKKRFTNWLTVFQRGWKLVGREREIQQSIKMSGVYYFPYVP